MPAIRSSARSRIPRRARRGNPPLGQTRHEPQHGGVAFEQLLQSGPLDLDHHVLAGGEHGSMRLPDGGCGQGLPLKGREHLVDGPGELLLDEAAQLLGGYLAHRGPKLGQLLGHRLREQVGARRGDLPELDEHPAAVLQREPEPATEFRRQHRVGRHELEPRQAPVAGVTENLPGASHRGQLLANPPERVQQRSPRPLAHPSPRGTQGLHDHDQDHGAEDPEEDGQQAPLEVAAVGRRSDRTGDPGEAPDECGQEAATPADPDPEQAPAHDGHQDHEQDRQDQRQDVLEFNGDRGHQVDG